MTRFELRGIHNWFAGSSKNKLVKQTQTAKKVETIIDKMYRETDQLIARLQRRIK